MLTRNYVSAWLAARRHRRPETESLQAVARRALAVFPRLLLPGGMPLVGDISPDCPPGFLAGRYRAALEELRQICGGTSPHRLAADGWHRLVSGPWAALWHAAPEGWSPMPGHGHQDMAGFELQHGDQCVFVDPGRGAYGPARETARHASAAVHITVTIDGHDPYSPNRPYYDSAFRRRVGGPLPRISRQKDGLVLSRDGFARLAGVGAVQRRLAFAPNALRITDRVEGVSRRTVTRRPLTTCKVWRDGDAALLEGRSVRFRLGATDVIALSPAPCWTAFGEGAHSTLIDISVTADLPIETAMLLERL